MPRAPLGLTRPLAPTIAPPGSPAPAARRRGASLSWRRARGVTAGASVHHDVHHHWPLTVNLLFRPTVVAPATQPSPAARTAAPTASKRASKTGTIMVWERREGARDAASQSQVGRTAIAPQLPVPPTSPTLATRARHAPLDEPPIFARTLHTLVEQRWLRTQTTRHLPSAHDEVRGLPTSSADHRPVVTQRSPQPDTHWASAPAAKRAAANFSRPMRPDDRPLFTGDPLVRRSLRRIAVTPLAHRSADPRHTTTGMRVTSPVRNAADIAPPRPARTARARPAEQFWPDPRTTTSQSLAQPFAPLFSSPGAATPAIAFAPGLAATPAAPAAPDVNRLVDEVMRRIERQTRQDRLRRGM
jgi:hypothetical protein